MTASATAATRTQPKATSLWRDTVSQILRQRSAVIGLMMLGVILLAALLADVLTPYGPLDQLYNVEGAQRLSGPCIHLLGCPESQPQFVMGLDQNNRDVFARVLHGARLSL